MIEFNQKQYRNLEEQVLANKKNIEGIIAGSLTLAEFGLKVVGQVSTQADLPSDYTGDYGDCMIVGQYATPPYNLAVWTRPFSDDGTDGFWLYLGQFPKAGPQGPQGIQGPTGSTG